jgi:hypothetical protein
MRQLFGWFCCGSEWAQVACVDFVVASGVLLV